MKKLTKILIMTSLMSAMLAACNNGASTQSASSSGTSNNISASNLVTNSSPPTQLDVFDAGAFQNSPAALLLLQGIEGLSVRYKLATQVYVIDSSHADGYQDDGYKIILDQLKIPYTMQTDLWQEVKTLKAAKPDLGYVLYDYTSNPDSANYAFSVASALGNVIPIDKTQEASAQQLGLVKVNDVSSPSVSYAKIFNQYKESLNSNFAIEQDPRNEPRSLRDYALANSAFVFFNASTSDTSLRDSVLAQLKPGAKLWGWGPTDSMGEYNFIYDTGGHGKMYIAADHAKNLSILNELAVNYPPQVVKQAPAQGLAYDANTNYVMLVMSDGDNVQWSLGRGNDKSWWGSQYRGVVPMTWTISPQLYYVAPMLWNYLMNTATNKDAFIIAPSGVGYNFGNLAQSSGWSANQQELSTFVNSSGLNGLSLFGYNDWSNSKYLNQFNTTNVQTELYFEYAGWITPTQNSSTQIIANHAVLPANELLQGNSINSVSDDICNTHRNKGFYVVYLNAWSVNNIDAMTAAYTTYQQVSSQCPNKVKFITYSDLPQLVKSAYNL